MSPTELEVLAKVRAFIEREFLYMRPDFTVGDDDDLMRAGVVDSMGVLEVMTFLDSEFGVLPADDEITEENLGSLRAISRFVAARATGD